MRTASIGGTIPTPESRAAEGNEPTHALRLPTDAGNDPAAVAGPAYAIAPPAGAKPMRLAQKSASDIDASCLVALTTSAESADSRFLSLAVVPLGEDGGLQ